MLGQMAKNTSAALKAVDTQSYHPECYTFCLKTKSLREEACALLDKPLMSSCVMPHQVIEAVTAHVSSIRFYIKLKSCPFCGVQNSKIMKAKRE